MTIKCDQMFPPDGLKGTGDNRPHAMWLQYDVNKCPSSEAGWQEMKFVHKESLGYMKWPE